MSRGEGGIKPETWAVIATIVAVFVVVVFWVRTTQDEAMADLASPQPVPASVAIPVEDETPVVYVENEFNAPDTTHQRWIYQCKTASGAKMFRSEGCAGDEELIGQTPVLVADAQPQHAPTASASTSTQSAAIHNGAQVAVIPNGNPQPAARSQCEMAKANREATRDRLGMSITYDAISGLDDMVREACK